MKRFHLTDNGPKPCTASVRDCPVGGAHFTNEGEAKLAYEFSAAKKHGVFGGLKKPQDPHMLHVSSAAKRLRQLEKDMLERDRRQAEEGTVFHQLLADGVSEEELEARFKEDTNTREAGIGYMSNSEGAVKPVGLSYGGDYKAEEEYGMAHIAKTLREGTAEKDDVLVYEKNGFTVMAVRGERSYGWADDDGSRVRSEQMALKRFKDWYNWDDRQLKWELERLSAADVKSRLNGRVKPAPKTKAAAITEILKLDGAQRRTPAIGEFQNGSALVIVTKDPIEAKLMKSLKEAHDEGHLRVGGTANPFGRGSLFYDERDLTREYKTDLVKDEEATRYAAAYVSDTKGKLESNGRVYAVSPSVDDSDGDIRKARFWLNYSPNNHKQIFGWFNKEQLERIAEGDYSEVKD